MADGWRGMVIPTREERAAALAEELERTRAPIVDYGDGDDDNDPPPKAPARKAWTNRCEPEYHRQLVRCLPGWVMDQVLRKNGRPLTPVMKRVLAVLKIRAGYDRGEPQLTAQLSVAELAAIAKCSDRQVQLVMLELEQCTLEGAPIALVTRAPEVEVGPCRSLERVYQLARELWLDRAGGRRLRGRSTATPEAPAAPPSTLTSPSLPSGEASAALSPTPPRVKELSHLRVKIKNLHSESLRAKDTDPGPPASGADGPTTERPGARDLAELCPDAGPSGPARGSPGGEPQDPCRPPPSGCSAAGRPRGVAR